MSSVPPKTVDGRVGLRAAVSRSALRLQSDRRLVALTRAGSGVAFSVIVERYHAPLLAYTRRLLGPDEAEDALQQTFVNALGALRRDDRAIDVRPWLYRIAHNVAVNALRRGGRPHEQLDDQFDGVPQPPDVLDQKLAVQRLVEGIGRLPERQREAIVAHELEGRSYEEIAYSMSATTPVVRQLVHRARTRLRDACGVLVPAWGLRWLLVADLRAAGSERVGEAVAGGAAGTGLLKAGTALLATGAIATGAGGLVVKHDLCTASDRHAPAAAEPQADEGGSLRGSNAQPAGAHVAALRPHATPDVNGAADHGLGGQGGERRPDSSRSGDDRNDPARSERDGSRDGEEGDDGAHEPEPGDTHEASHEESDGHRGDSGGSGGSGSGESSGGGSGEASGGSEGSDSQDGSGSPDSPSSGPSEP